MRRLATMPKFKMPSSWSKPKSKWRALYLSGNYEQLYLETRENDSCDEALFYCAEAALYRAHSTHHQENPDSLYNEACSRYEKLLNSPQFKHYAKLGLAEMHRIMGRMEQGAALYLELAEEEIDPEVLLHAAMGLIRADPEQGELLFKS